MRGRIGRSVAGLLFGAVLAAYPSSAPAALPSGLRLRGDAAFQGRAREALARLGGTRAGGRLLAELDAFGRRVTLRPGAQERTGALFVATGGGDSVILWDPGFSFPDFPPALLLYHELLHALHEAQGTREAGEAEERRAVGLGEHAGYALSENALRAELGLAPRRGTKRAEFEAAEGVEPSR